MKIKKILSEFPDDYDVSILDMVFPGLSVERNIIGIKKNDVTKEITIELAPLPHGEA